MLPEHQRVIYQVLKRGIVLSLWMFWRWSPSSVPLQFALTIAILKSALVALEKRVHRALALRFNPLNVKIGRGTERIFLKPAYRHLKSSLFLSSPEFPLLLSLVISYITFNFNSFFDLRSVPTSSLSGSRSSKWHATSRRRLASHCTLLASSSLFLLDFPWASVTDFKALWDCLQGVQGVDVDFSDLGDDKGANFLQSCSSFARSGLLGWS